MNDAKVKTRSIDLSVEISATKEQVWTALTNAEQLSSWFPLHAEIKPGDGGEVLLSWGEGVEWTTKIDMWKPGQQLRWVDPPAVPGGPPVATDFHIRTVAGQVTLRLVNSGFGEDDKWDEQFEGTKAGWMYFLYNLQHYLTHHLGAVRDMIWTRFPISGSRVEIWSQIIDSAAGFVLSGGSDPQIGGLLQIQITPDDVVEGLIEVIAPPRTLGIRLPSLNESLLFIEIEPGSKNCSTGFWLSTYGLSAVDELRSRFLASLERFNRPDS